MSAAAHPIARVHGAWRRAWRRMAPATLVLLYHRVAPRPSHDVNQLVVTPDNFAAQLAWLAAHVQFIDEERLLAMRAARRGGWPLVDAGRPRVLITFDDGYADNIAHALPLLRAHGAAATLLVATAAIGTSRLYWWDALERIVFEARKPATEWASSEGEHALADASPLERYARLHGQLKPLTAAARDARLAQLADLAGVSLVADDERRPATAAELRAWCEAGGAIGGHTRTHVQLSVQTDDVLAAEIGGCRRDLQRLGLGGVHTFSYPFGAGADFDARCELAVREAGFACAFANRVGNVRWARDEFALPRCLVRDWSCAEFEARFNAWSPQ